MRSQVKDGQSMVEAAGLISGLTLVSRILGLVREQVFAALLGAGLHADAFQIAFRIPNLLRDLFAEGALSAAFVPTYARVQAEEGREQAHRLGSRLLALLAVVLGALVGAGLLLAGPLVSALAPGFDLVPGKAEITVLLTRVMLPFLPLVSFAAVAMGMLNAEERYAAPAFAPAMFNVVAIVWAAGLWALGFAPEQVALGWAVGTLLGGAAQFLVQVPPLVRGGWRFRPEWAPADPAIRRIGALMAPATLGLAAVQVNIFVNSVFASHEAGAVAWLNYAFRILYLPIGLFGVALGTIATTGLARRAATGDLDGLRETLRQTLRMLAFLTLPATVGLVVLGAPIVRLVYQRGRFQPSDTDATAAALGLYAIGLLAYTGVKVLAPAFYALGAPRVPLVASVAAVLTNLAVNLALFDRVGFRSVALGTSLGSFVNVLVLLALFERRVGGLRAHGLGRALVRIAAATVPMGLLAWGAARGLESWLGTQGLAAQLANGLLPVGLGVLAYASVALGSGFPEARSIASALRRRR
ncbi:MAG: murein biosynthesis integral membrane protein MurJ [Acidobacteria bacterium]|nr:murein biosynthesis integral membrane protein MurJ [Acidobacteriota bacterium]